MPAQRPPAPPTVGAVAIWSSSDLPGLGDQTLGRVVQHELLARLPGWRMSLFAPLGWDRPRVTDGGVVAEPLRDYATRADALAGGATLSVVCPAFPLGIDAADHYGDERAGAAMRLLSGGLGATIESGHPVLPFGVRVADPVPPSLVSLVSRTPTISVRDPASRDRLRDAGVDREIPVIPHPALLVGRAIDVDTLPVRRQQLRQLGILPDAAYVASFEPAADLDVVIPPADLAFEDRLAIIAGARAVIATDEHVAAVAAGLGVPWALVDPRSEHRDAAGEFGHADQIVESYDAVAGALRAAETETEAAQGESHRAAVVAQLDRIAEVAERALVDGGGDLHRHWAILAGENAALRRAHWRQRERILVERQRLAEPLADAMYQRDRAVTELARVTAERDELARRHEELAAWVAEYERELSAWQNTKLVRWSRPLRQAYGRVRNR